jgi:hypothetical protein
MPALGAAGARSRTLGALAHVLARALASTVIRAAARETGTAGGQTGTAEGARDGHAGLTGPAPLAWETARHLLDARG